MRFEKKLIILNGESTAKGTLSLERNAYGLFATLNVYSLSELKRGQYCIGLKTPDAIFVRELGNKGRILSRFEISNMDLEQIHAVLFDMEKEEALLYGTSSTTKLWTANRMDGFRSSKQNASLPVVPQESASISSNMEPNNKDIRDYFFDIAPQASNEIPAEKLMQSAVKIAKENESSYNDTAVASINYYNQKPHTTNLYSNQEETNTPKLKNPIDQYFTQIENEHIQINNTNQHSSNNNSSAIPSLPWEHQKVYIQKLKHTLTPIPVRDPSHAISEITPPSNARINNAFIPKPQQSYGMSKRKSSQKNPIHISSLSEAATTVPPLSSYNATQSATKIKPELNFYEQIKSQLDSLFKDNEHYTPLENLMPDTKWAKVLFDTNKFYVVGLIGKAPEYIAYGVPSNFSETPPEELGTEARWMPENPSNPKSNGFWLMFQDAATGEAV
ncbi:MAG: hypothetical protein FWE13_05375 [Firmicutes bacterium]|nr:hypothetical protein [Bacillota bacterium]